MNSTKISDPGAVRDMYNADELEKMIRECGFSISRNAVVLEEEMMMNAVYIDCVRD